jgi:D-tyrosyl-tRNA(Tyr) deacylase
MKAVVQRVSSAGVHIDGAVYSSIGGGLLVLLGIEKGDSEEKARSLASKITELRIFEDDQAKMNRSVTEVRGAILVVSQFTLAGDCSRGRRPSFDRAARPEEARPLYEVFVEQIRSLGIPVETGVFQAMMDVELTNNGPVTFILE